jgi:PTH2 family peptidyl-tRNA hydrolase
MTHKQVIVMRKDLGMRKGKMVAQGCHASLGVITNYLKDHSHAQLLEDPRTWPWLASSFTKICVYVESEEELLALEAKAKEQGVLSCLITDSGKTEFSGIPTKTCIAIGPDTIERVDNVTGGLPLL